MVMGSLKSPSLFWLDDGDVGADCSALSSGCSCENPMNKDNILAPIKTYKSFFYMIVVCYMKVDQFSTEFRE